MKIKYYPGLIDYCSIIFRMSLTLRYIFLTGIVVGGCYLYLRYYGYFSNSEKPNRAEIANLEKPNIHIQ